MGNESKYKRALVSVTFAALLFLGFSTAIQDQGKTDNTPDWFYPEWAANAKYNQPIRVLDTESALGRYATKTKQIGLKDLARVHGHLCDGLVIAFVEIRAVLEKLFPNGIVDRTDLRAVSKNGPCWVDAVAIMTGARINFQTLRIDNRIGDGFIIQRISTGETYDVHLKPGVFPAEQANLENKIRTFRAEGKPVSKEDIDRLEAMADSLSKFILNSEPNRILEITLLRDYKFIFNDLYNIRTDIINKDMPR